MEYNYIEQGATPVASLPLIGIIVVAIPVVVMAYIVYKLFRAQLIIAKEEVIESE